jgi:hypothetical protein
MGAVEFHASPSGEGQLSRLGCLASIFPDREYVIFDHD